MAKESLNEKGLNLWIDYENGNSEIAFEIIKEPPLKKFRGAISQNSELFIFLLFNIHFNQKEKTIGDPASQASPTEIENKVLVLDDSNKPSNNSNKTLQRKAQKVLLKFNQLYSKNYKMDCKGIKLIETCLKKYSIQDCFKVMETKLHDPHFKTNPHYYRPSTLFRLSNFENYINEDPTQYSKQNKTPSNGSGLSGMKYDPNEKYARKSEWMTNISNGDDLEAPILKSWEKGYHEQQRQFKAGILNGIIPEGAK